MSGFISVLTINEFHSHPDHRRVQYIQVTCRPHAASESKPGSHCIRWVTSRIRHSFFSANAFFLDEDTFEPRKAVFGLPNITTAHTGENISGAVLDVLDEFELIANNKVGYVVLDNAASNDSAVEEIGDKFQ